MDKEEEKMLSAVSTWVEGKQVGAIYIARDEGVCYDEDERKSQGKLHLFYDTPLIHRDPQTNTLKFDCATDVLLKSQAICILTLTRVTVTKSA